MGSRELWQRGLNSFRVHLKAHGNISGEFIEAPIFYNHWLAMYYAKVVILGEACVGKSALCQRYASDKFPEKYLMTIGIEFVRFCSLFIFSI